MQNLDEIKLKRRRRILAIVSVTVIVLVLGGLTVLLWNYFKHIATSQEGFRAYIQGFGWAAPLVFIGLHMLQVIVALLPGEVLEIGAGFAFGAVEGTILCLIASALSSALVFAAVKRWGVKLIELFFDPDKINNMKFLRDETRVKRLTFILFLIPGSPKDLLTYLAGLTRLRVMEFVIIATLARIPSIVSSTVGGHYLETGDYLTAGIVFAVTALISVAGLLAYSKISAIHRRKQTEPADPPSESE